MPGVHTRLTAIQTSVDNSKTVLQNDLHHFSERLFTSMESLNRSTKLELAKQFASVAITLAQDNKDVGDVEDEEYEDEEEQPVHKASKQKASKQITEASKQITEEFSNVSRYRISVVAKSVRLLYYSFKGLHMFDCIPMKGGVVAAERKYGTKWRTGFSGSEAMEYSRSSRLIGAIDKKVEEGYGTLEAILDQCDVLFEEELHSLHKMVDRLKRAGWILPARRVPAA
jgi:hypothetical protein